jgi:hypothetical protein
VNEQVTNTIFSASSTFFAFSKPLASKKLIILVVSSALRLQPLVKTKKLFFFIEKTKKQFD